MRIRLSLLLLFSLLTCTAFSQVNLVERSFADRSNFEILTAMGGKMPAKYLVLEETEGWSSNRFQLDDDLENDSVRNSIKYDEHHPYHSIYLFRDSALSKLFSKPERMRLHHTAMGLSPRKLTDPIAGVSFIPSLEDAPQGYFFSVTDPVYTTDNQYAFIDISIYLHEKDEDGNPVINAYGSVVIVYRYANGNWNKFKKSDSLIL